MQLTLHPRQGEVINSKATEILFGGAAGGGKSHLLRILAIIYAIDIPGIQIYLFRRHYSDLIQNHNTGPASFPILLGEFIDNKNVRYNSSRSCWDFWNGSRIQLAAIQHDKDLHKYLGTEMHVLLFDELTTFTEEQYLFLRSRLRVAGLEIPKKYKDLVPRIVCGSNPGGLGHTWVKKSFVDVDRPMAINRMPKDHGGLLRQFVPSKLQDNPTLIETDPDYADRLLGMGNETLIKAYLDGDWNIVAGSFFDIFDYDTHVLERTDFPYGEWTFNKAFDWGYSAPFAVGYFAEALVDSKLTWPNGTTKTFKRGTVIMFNEIYGCKHDKPQQGLKWNPQQIARHIVETEELFPDIRVSAGPADNSIFDSDSSIATEMSQLGVHWTRSNKARIPGWQKVLLYLKNATQTPMEKPGLFFFENCKHTIRTLPTLPRDPNKPDDVDTASEDHIADMLRYRIMSSAQRLSTVGLTGI